MSDVRIIKKYPNRRLYDTSESRYITLNDIRQLVLKDEPFEVIDKRTGRNITRCILLQVITEQEQRGEAVMSEDFLAQIIRAYSGTMPQAARRYLEESLALFLAQQRKAGESLRGAVVSGNPLTAMAELAQQNLGQWLDLQKQMLKTFQAGPSGGAEAPPTASSGHRHR